MDKLIKHLRSKTIFIGVCVVDVNYDLLSFLIKCIKYPKYVGVFHLAVPHVEVYPADIEC